MYLTSKINKIAILKTYLSNKFADSQDGRVAMMTKLAQINF